MKKLFLQPDTPIEVSIDPFLNDLLEFKESVTRIGSLLPHVSTPFTIGIYGNWGSGKTSYMKMLSTYANQNNMKTFWFNAWEYENETSLLLPLLSKLANEVNHENKLFKSIKKIAAAVIMTGANFTTKLATLNTTNIKDIERYLKEYEEHISTSYEKWISDIDKLKNEFKNLVREICNDKESLVLFIDDLDRCLPENIIKLIENIKHFLTADGCDCIFVIGVDQSILSAAIKARYGSEIIKGSEYLEKIINLSINIPGHNHTASKDYILAASQKMTDSSWYKEIEEDVSLFANLLSKIGEKNPRRIKILITRYLLFLAFIDGQKYLMEIIVRLIIIKEFFPGAYKMKEEINSVNYAPHISSGVMGGRSKTFEEIEEMSCRDFAIIATKREFSQLFDFGQNINWFILNCFEKSATEIKSILAAEVIPYDGGTYDKPQIEKYIVDEVNLIHKNYFSTVNFMFSLNQESLIHISKEESEPHTFQEKG